MTTNKPTGMMDFKAALKPIVTKEERKMLAAKADSIQSESFKPNKWAKGDETSDVEAAHSPVASTPKAESAQKTERKTRSAKDSAVPEASKIVKFRLAGEELEELSNIADKNFSTVSRLVRGIVSEWLQNNKKS